MQTSTSRLRSCSSASGFRQLPVKPPHREHKPDSPGDAPGQSLLHAGQAPLTLLWPSSPGLSGPSPVTHTSAELCPVRGST